MTMVTTEIKNNIIEALRFIKQKDYGSAKNSVGEAYKIAQESNDKAGIALNDN